MGYGGKMEEQNEKQQSQYVEKIAEENERFCIIGVTGKIGAGTSDVCKLLSDPNFPDWTTKPADTSGHDMSDMREHLVVYRYLHHNWRPFIHLSMTNIIVSFLIDADTKFMKEEISGTKKLEEIVTVAIREIKAEQVIAEAIKNNNVLFSDELKKAKIRTEIEKNKEIYKEIDSINALKILWGKVKNHVEDKQTTVEDFVFCFGYLPLLKKGIKKQLERSAYTILFQKLGNNIRAYGEALVKNEEKKPDAENLFAISHRANRFIKLLRFHGSEYLSSDGDNRSDEQTERKPESAVFVVISSFKNIFEAYYFKKRYSAFYLVAVSCDEEMRRNQFNDLSKFRLTELRENLSSGKRVYRRVQEKRKEINGEETRDSLGLNDSEYEFWREICEKNPLQKMAYENNIANFILQDVVTCVENADIFVSRNYDEPNYKFDYDLIYQLGRNITLMLHPGLLTPTKIEKCMQIAISAKLNSGCLSRQVGAVVADSEYEILSVGWNDAPCGDESCIRRNLYDLFQKRDPDAYSQFEREDDEFRSYLEKIEQTLNEKKKQLHGLPLAFCFKDIYQDIISQRDQIYTRALHGEERALVACDGERAQGGYLFTTSSPCELCAKKAKEAKISKIYYIEQYPGISRSHIINYGPKKGRIEYKLFVGAVGLAYMKLYTPVMPYKDELTILGYSPKNIYEQIKKEDKKRNEKENEGGTKNRRDPEQVQQIRQDK